MKLYIIPIQNACNANCIFCITKHKKETGFGEKLNIKHLNKINNLEIDKIEITGGGEPLLHPKIEEIIKISSKKAPTQLYTNGALIKKLNNQTVKKLSRICLSRSHHQENVNQKIMRIKYDLPAINKISKLIPIKLSVVLCQSGISTANQLLDFINWGKEKFNIEEMVVRQMFDYSYPTPLIKEIVKVDKLFPKLEKIYKLINHVNENPVLLINGVKIEFEREICACQLDNLVLRPNGLIYQGWGKEMHEP